MLRLLIEHGANPFLKNMKGDSALDVARYWDEDRQDATSHELLILEAVELSGD